MKPNFFLTLESKNFYSYYASIFRIYLCFHLLKKVFISFGSIDILYRKNSFIPFQNIEILEFFGLRTHVIRENIEAFLFIFILLLLLFFFGIGKRVIVIMLYIQLEILQRLNFLVLNGGDNLLKFIMLYMIFIDSYNFFSIKKIAFRSLQKKRVSTFISNIACFSICLHLCFAYLISGLNKIHSDLWFNGVATYYTLSLERFRGTPLNLSLVKNGTLVTLSTYFTILIEIYYPVLIWIKKCKKIISLLAIMLHLGIYVFMMIYDFQILFIMLQGFFFNKEIIAFTNKIKRSFRRKRYFYKKQQ